MKPLRKPRNLVLGTCSCHWRTKDAKMPDGLSEEGFAKWFMESRMPLKVLSYGTVMVECASERKTDGPRLIKKAKADIAKTVRKHKLTFCRWWSEYRGFDVEYRYHLWSVGCDVIWDDAYEKIREDK